MASDATEWVHATNAQDFGRGDVFGWRDARSETGLLSGIVVRTAHLSVEVRDIRAGILTHQSRPDPDASSPTATDATR